MKLSTQNLIKKYGSRAVVKEVSFDVTQGEIVGLLGPNGAGKTTSFYMIVGLITPNKGKIFLDDGILLNFLYIREPAEELDISPRKHLYSGN